ncbi:MAG: hypothetical protein IJW55_07195 [Clostridia bacterium]|nr:hypothetical protein [Clostridia bacterium]
MVENQKFSYNYSATANREVEEIRKRYLPKKVDKMEELKHLDHRVQSAGMTESLSVGIIGCLIFGIGMCAGLNVIGGGMVLAVVLGIIGVVLMLPAYPIYRLLSKRAREKYTARILKLADEISGEKK